MKKTLQNSGTPELGTREAEAEASHRSGQPVWRACLNTSNLSKEDTHIPHYVELQPSSLDPLSCSTNNHDGRQIRCQGPLRLSRPFLRIELGSWTPLPLLQAESCTREQR